jgi:hypothetical protein
MASGAVPQAGESYQTVFLISIGGINMAAANNTGTGSRGQAVPAMQRVLDNPFLLLFIGVVVPTVFYILWGIMEVVTIPLAK